MEGTSGSRWMPRKMSGIAISVIEASRVASRTAEGASSRARSTCSGPARLRLYRQPVQVTCLFRSYTQPMATTAKTRNDTARTASELRVVLGQLMRRLRAEHRFPFQHGAVLGRLDREGPASVSDLAVAEKVRPQSMAQTVGELEADGLVKRRAGPRGPPQGHRRADRRRPGHARGRPEPPGRLAGLGDRGAPEGGSGGARPRHFNPRRLVGERRLNCLLAVWVSRAWAQIGHHSVASLAQWRARNRDRARSRSVRARKPVLISTRAIAGSTQAIPASTRHRMRRRQSRGAARGLFNTGRGAR